MAQGALLCSLLARVTALGHQSAGTVMVHVVTQAIPVTSSKARAEFRRFNLYFKSELRAPTLPILMDDKNKGTMTNCSHLKQKWL